MNKYLRTTLNNAQRTIVYRARMVVWLLIDTLHFIIFPFIWLAIFGERQMIAGFTRADIITYYIAIAFVSLIANAHINRRIKIDIMEGDMNAYLVKPIRYYFYCISQECGYKLIAVPLFVVLLIIAYFIFPDYIVLPAKIATIIFFIVSLIMSYAISSLLEFIIGVATFWLGETTALLHAKQILENMFNGKIAPLSFFPTLLQSVAAILPFQYVAYIPAQILLERITPDKIIQHMASAVIWIIALSGIAWILWHKGIRAYEGTEGMTSRSSV